MGNIVGHLPVLSTNRGSQFNFSCPVFFWNAGHQLLQALFPSYAPCGSNDNHAVLCGHIDEITHRNAGFLKNLLSKTEPLTVTPFLNFCNHVDTALVYTKYSSLWSANSIRGSTIWFLGSRIYRQSGEATGWRAYNFILISLFKRISSTFRRESNTDKT